MRLNTVLFFLLFSFIAIAQDEVKYESISSTKEKLATFKVDGCYNFRLFETFTKQNVMESANYYTEYFVVEYEEVLKDLKIKMLKNDEQSRHVLCRYFSTLEIKKIEVDGKLYDLENFYQLFLK